MDIAHIVDRVGSGDGFAAGLIYGLQKLPTAREPPEFAVAAGCLKHSMPRYFNRSTVEEVDALLKDGGSGRVPRQRSSRNLLTRTGETHGDRRLSIPVVSPQRST